MGDDVVTHCDGEVPAMLRPLRRYPAKSVVRRLQHFLFGYSRLDMDRRLCCCAGEQSDI